MLRKFKSMLCLLLMIVLSNLGALGVASAQTAAKPTSTPLSVPTGNPVPVPKPKATTVLPPNPGFILSADDYLNLANFAADLNRYLLLADAVESMLFSKRALSPIEEKSSRRNAIAVSREMLEIVKRMEKTAPRLAKYQPAASEQLLKSGLERAFYSPSGKLRLLSISGEDVFLNKWSELNKNGTGFIEISKRLVSGAPLQKESIGKLISALEKGVSINPPAGSGKFKLKDLWKRITEWVDTHLCEISWGLMFVGAVTSPVILGAAAVASAIACGA